MPGCADGGIAAAAAAAAAVLLVGVCAAGVLRMACNTEGNN